MGCLTSCPDKCDHAYLGDLICDADCDDAGCFYDMGDCDCSEGCNKGLLENDVCDEVCNVAACSFDNGVCGD